MAFNDWLNMVCRIEPKCAYSFGSNCYLRDSFTVFTLTTRGSNMRWLVITLCLFVFGCGSAKDQTHEYDIYLQKFNNDIVKLGYDPIDFSLTVVREFDNLTNNGDAALGACHNDALKNKGLTGIFIDKSVSSFESYAQQVLIYHEIGHCFLGLGHVFTHSIMNPGHPRVIVTTDEMSNDGSRLALVKTMIESSKYADLHFVGN